VYSERDRETSVREREMGVAMELLRVK